MTTVGQRPDVMPQSVHGSGSPSPNTQPQATWLQEGIWEDREKPLRFF